MGFMVWTYVLSSVLLAGEKPEAAPTLRLEKSTYVLGESIRFWIGVRPKGNATIPEKYWSTCYLHITRPDGTSTKQSVDWPSDGIIDLGWTGGRGLRGEEVRTGKYTLVFEFAEKRTSPVELTVKELAVIRDICVGFFFGKNGTVKQDEVVPVVLRLENKTRHLVRFPVLGMGSTPVSIRVSSKDPPRGSSFFYPYEKLPGSEVKILVDTCDWAFLKRVPFVVVKPGEKFELKLCLQDACQFWGPGEYKVTFKTTLPLLLGDANGEFANVCPIRLPVVSSEVFTIDEEEVLEKDERE